MFFNVPALSDETKRKKKLTPPPKFEIWMSNGHTIPIGCDYTILTQQFNLASLTADVKCQAATKNRQVICLDNLSRDIAETLVNKAIKYARHHSSCRNGSEKFLKFGFRKMPNSWILLYISLYPFVMG